MEIESIHEKMYQALTKYHKADKNFLFTFRKINRNARLEKGYWFLGDDNYLAVSFWTGRDLITKMPKISFIVRKDGTSLLEFSSKYTSMKMEYFDEAMIAAVGANPIGYEEGYRKFYSQFGTDFLKSLHEFIQTDKIIIDNYVANGNAFNPAALEYTEQLEFLYSADFDKQFKNVLIYRKRLKDRQRKSGYLKSFSITNFGHITNVSIDGIPENCRWIFITGENGAGKTTLLKALATGLLQNNDNGEKIADGFGNFSLTLSTSTVNGTENHHVTYSDEILDKKKIPKGFCAYGPVRLVTQGSLNSQYLSIDSESIVKKLTFGLFNPIGVLRDLSGSYPMAVKPKYFEMTFDSLVENLEFIIPNVLRVIVEPFNQGHILKYVQKLPNTEMESEPITFEQLPSATRNFAALIVDLLIRFVEQQPDISDPANYVGIVLIDEIDLHLHPKMQKEIIEQLSSTFPNIQFIVTTHSPIPLLGAPQNSCFINVSRDDSNDIVAKKLNINITNLLPNAILSSPIFDFDSLISNAHNPQERLVTEDDYDEAVFYKILERKIRENTLKPQ